MNGCILQGLEDADFNDEKRAEVAKELLGMQSVSRG
jgi:hypothetical protein